ncbi:MAG: hypothetical protein K1X71_00075 [Pirellulales bacterium]|nr:hypothetical protein [Pirellulales bacterium]
MPKLYDRLGLRFQYPDNWTLDEAEALAGNHSVSVYSPTGAFWSVAVRPRDADSGRAASTALAAMREEYNDLEAEPTTDCVAGHELTGFEINFCYLDLTSTAGVRCAELDQSTLVIFYQAEDRDYIAVEPVFRAMTYSLLTSLSS